MSRTPDSDQTPRPAAVAVVHALTALITTAMISWPTTLRLMVICVAMALPTAAGLALYLLIR